MKLRNIRKFIKTADPDDIKFVAGKAGISAHYLQYHIAKDRKTPTEETARLLELASISLSKRKPHIPVLHCTDFIDSYVRCPHKVGE